VLGWGGYTAAGAGWTYFTTQELVDQVLREASNRYRTSLSTTGQSDAVASYVRTTLLVSARRDGLLVQDSDVQVQATAAQVSATVRWSHPILSLRGQDLLVVPMTVQRSLATTP
jgi:hypothetical protein